MENTALLLILTGVAWLAVFAVALVLFLRWGKRDRKNRP
jgi:hypothetical protein